MQMILKLVAAVVAVMLAGCSSPKPPPGWPTGEERPINSSQVTKAVK